MEEDLGGYCGIRSPHDFDKCSQHDHSTSDILSRPSPTLFAPLAPGEPLETYVIKANGTPINVFSDEEFVESCCESETEANKPDNDCERVSKMFNKLVGFVLDVEQYLFKSESITKAELFRKVTSTRKMLKRNSDLFFDMADFLASKCSSQSSNGMSNEKRQSNEEFISHNLEVNTKDKIQSSSSSAENAAKRLKRSKKRYSKKRSSTSGHKQDSKLTLVNNNTNNSNKENRTVPAEGFVERRRSTRPRTRRSVYFNGEKMHLNSDGELIPLSGKTTETEENQTITRKRKTTATTPKIDQLKSDSSQNLSMKRQLYSPDVWLQHINRTGIDY